MVKQMDDAGVFRDDAQNLILASLGMDDGRLASLPAQTQTDQERRERLTEPATFSLVDLAEAAANGHSNGANFTQRPAGR